MTMRARSCPSCHSMGRPRDDCQDPWHDERPAPTPALLPPTLMDKVRHAMQIPQVEPVLSQLAAQAQACASAHTALDRQVGGDHYKDMAIQPVEYILANDIPWAEGTAIKYITRWRSKGGVEDLRKAIHILELLIEHEEASGAGPTT